MAGKKKIKAPAETEIDPRFMPVVKAFAKDRKVSGGKMMSAYGLRVGGKIFAMFPRGEFVAKLPKPRVDELVDTGKGEKLLIYKYRRRKGYRRKNGHRQLFTAVKITGITA